MLFLHGVEVGPLELPGHHLRSSDKLEGRGQQVTEAVASGRTSPSKRQQRSSQRLLIFQAKKRAALWLSFAQRILKQSRAKLRGSTKISWLASRSPSTSPPPVAASVPAVQYSLTPAPGTRAQLFGLKSRPELNEIVGVVGDYDEAAERYALLLPSGDSIAVKLSNLDVQPQLIPVLHDLPENVRSNAKRTSRGKRPKPKRH